jgi:hypothetical protein
VQLDDFVPLIDADNCPSEIDDERILGLVFSTQMEGERSQPKNTLAASCAPVPRVGSDPVFSPIGSTFSPAQTNSVSGLELTAGTGFGPYFN